MNRYKVRYGFSSNGWSKNWQLWQEYKYMEHDKWIYSWHKICQGNLDFILSALERRLTSV